MASRALKNFLKRQWFRTFMLSERLGWHLVPVNYYSPLTQLGELRRTRERWARRSNMAGIAVDLDAQVACLRAMVAPFVSEVAGGAVYERARQLGYGPGYGYIEAQALHAVVRSLKPRRIIEVGSGVSTACALRAGEMNAAEGAPAPAITCIEPFPHAPLRKQASITLIEKPVQDVPVEAFAALDAGDLLFIDSTHVTKPGSDVNHLFLDVLPTLRPGVVVHVHDIFLPFQHGPFVLKQFFAPNETAVLQAYMAHNPKVETLFCLSHLFHDRAAALKQIFPDFDPQQVDSVTGLEPDSVPPFFPNTKHFPTSIYLRTK